MKSPITIMLADDDNDDHFFFDLILKELPLKTRLLKAFNGVELMRYLTDEKQALPDIIFLDINMPCKNGLECLNEIKSNHRLKHLPVVIHSTSTAKETRETCYNSGAEYYIHKSGLTELKGLLSKVLTTIFYSVYKHPTKEEFFL